jgi:hypothetical protein
MRIAVVVLGLAGALVMSGCSSVPVTQTPTTESPGELPSAPATRAPLAFEPLHSYATALPFGGNCANAVSESDMAAVFGEPMTDVSSQQNSLDLVEKYQLLTVGTLGCEWQSPTGASEAWGLVFDEALVPFPGKSVECTTDDSGDGGRCFVDVAAGGLWASMTLDVPDGYSEARVREGAAKLEAAFADHASPAQHATFVPLPDGVWPVRDTCDDFADVDFSALTKRKVHLETAVFTRGEGEEDGRGIGLAAAGGLECNIVETKPAKGTPGWVGSFHVNRGMAGSTAWKMDEPGEPATIAGADSALYWQHQEDMNYLVVSGPNLLLANINTYQGKHSDERTIVAALLAAAKAG